MSGSSDQDADVIPSTAEVHGTSDTAREIDSAGTSDTPSSGTPGGAGAPGPAERPRELADTPARPVRSPDQGGGPEPGATGGPTTAADPVPTDAAEEVLASEGARQTTETLRSIGRLEQAN